MKCIICEKEIERSYGGPELNGAYCAQCAMGISIREMGRAMSTFAQSIGDYISEILDDVISVVRENLLQDKAEKDAIKASSTRVRHLATHGKKRRTRKKNINRAMREYQKRTGAGLVR